MLAARIQRLARSFATVADATGVKVAAFDAGQPTASVTLLVKAGSRYQSKDGVANALKNFAFKVSIGYFLTLSRLIFGVEYEETVCYWHCSGK